MTNDLISRSALIEKIQPVDFLYGDDEAPAYSGMAVSSGDIESAPAVDAVEAVRCKDCDRLIYLDDYPAPDYPYCEWWQYEVDPEFDYCSKAERKTDA